MSNPNLNPTSILPDDGRVAYSVVEVVRMLGISESTVFRRIKSGQLKCRQSEGRTLILKRDLAAYLEMLPGNHLATV